MKDIIHKMFVASLTEEVLEDSLQHLGRRGQSDNGVHHTGPRLSPEKWYSSLARSHEDCGERVEKWGQETDSQKKKEKKKRSKAEQYIQHWDFLIPRKMNHGELSGSYHL